MKRKRKHKKAKAKKGSAASSTKPAISSSVNVENDSGLDERGDSAAMEIDTPSSTATDHPQSVANANPNPNPEGSVSKGAVGKPLKVKLKTPKVTNSQLTSSDVPTQSDTDKSSHQTGLEKQSVAAEKTEDSADSSPLQNLTKKGTGTIKIKSSKVLGSSVAVPMRDENPTPSQKEQKTSLQGPPRYDKQELDTALTVIKKVMKMDAAEPFNVPVNPVALGIPDYFDVIDTPMDFGTICSNLESGAKYTNSEDVYKDVQYIWDNCFKYNSKGDYILDLMKRVKKNFAKLWTIAGLHSEQTIGTNGAESSQEKIAPTGLIKVYMKGGLSKKTSKKGHGRRHKSDCLCAICVLKRRRREREENARIAIGEASPDESPSGDNSTSDMDESQLDQNAGTEVKTEESKQPGRSLEDKEEDDEDNRDEEEEEEEENDVELEDNDNSETTEQANKQTLQELAEKSCEDYVIEIGDEIEPAQQHKHQHEELQEKPRKVKASQIKVNENPMLLNLCGTLFPDKGKTSIWSGPHSLVRRPSSDSPTCSTSIHAAIDMLMKHSNKPI